MGQILLTILSIGFLMIVHETGHFLAARRFGMRVKTFSIGIGPRIFRHKPEGSETTYQLAAIPFLAYVQIAGMNPFEEQDPKDKGSYANASWWGRIITVFAGPLANYLFASVLLFGVFAIGGDAKPEPSTRIEIASPDGPAALSGMKDGDRIVAVDGKTIATWDDLTGAVGGSAGKQLDITVDRAGETMHFKPVPKAGGDNKGKIFVRQPYIRVKVSVGEAARRSLMLPPIIVYEQIKGITLMLTGRIKPELSGPVGMFREVKKSFDKDLTEGFFFVALISASIAAFNMLPFPALDGGRLLFLAFEAVSRRKADQKMEAKIHAIGLAMLLGIVAIVTFREVLPK
jgi:regulator of sigma E protease